MKNRSLPILLGLLLAGIAPGKTIPTFAKANLVLGHTDFDTATPPLLSSFSLDFPTAVVIDPMTRKLFVADDDNHRILRYPSVNSLSNGAGAEAVFEQPRFSTNASGSGDLGIGNVRGLFFDRRGRLWVADESNNRVLMWEAASFRDTQAYPDRVYGQPDFATSSSDTTASKMSLPEGVWVDSEDRLWVAEFGNNRVLRFDAISTKANGAAADGVLGQALFTTNTFGSGSSGFQNPIGIAISKSGALYVAQSAGRRVLRFDAAASLGNGAGANAVLGQATFSTTTSGLSATQFARSVGVWITPDDTLWVADQNNHRLMRFDKASTKANGAAADGVVGQPDFVTNAFLTNNRSISGPFFQPFVDVTGDLWVGDSNNNRVLRFPPDTTAPLLKVLTKVPGSTGSGSFKIKGTASDAFGIARVQYRVNNGSTKTATGKTSWQFTAALKNGDNKILINAIDSVGNKSKNKVIRIERD